MTEEYINGRKIVNKKNGIYTVLCMACMNTAKGRKTDLLKRTCSFCNKKLLKQRRYSGRIYNNSKEKIEVIKNKYKNGVSIKVINSLVDELISQGEWYNG